MRKNKRKPVAPAPRNTRSDARRLFPGWSREMQARWVLAKLRTRSGTWAFPIGFRAVVEPAPDFLRVLPKDSAPLVVREDARDVMQRTFRYVKGFAK